MSRLPDTAESIFCPAEISVSTSGPSFAAIVAGMLGPSEFGILSWTCPCACAEAPCFEAASCCWSVRRGSDTKPDIQWKISSTSVCCCGLREQTKAKIELSAGSHVGSWRKEADLMSQ